MARFSTRPVSSLAVLPLPRALGVGMKGQSLVGGLLVGSIEPMLIKPLGLERLQENLRAQLAVLAKSKPRQSEEDGMLSEIARLEGELSVLKDDLVCLPCFFWHVRFDKACSLECYH